MGVYPWFNPSNSLQVQKLLPLCETWPLRQHGSQHGRASKFHITEPGDVATEANHPSHVPELRWMATAVRQHRQFRMCHLQRKKIILIPAKSNIVQPCPTQQLAVLTSANFESTGRARTEISVPGPFRIWPSRGHTLESERTAIPMCRFFRSQDFSRCFKPIWLFFLMGHQHLQNFAVRGHSPWCAHGLRLALSNIYWRGGVGWNSPNRLVNAW